MNTLFPFPAIWYGIGLEDLRPINATYGGEPLEKLPPIEAEHLDGQFRYLNNEVIRALENEPSDHVAITSQSINETNYLAEDARWKAKIEQIQASLPAYIVLPKPLVTFMSSSLAQYLVPSCTACYFDLPEKATPFNWLEERGYLFHFYRDQQDCLFWYYYVRENGEDCIVCSPIPLFDETITNDLTDEIMKREVLYTADTFEEFIYRTWVENLLWFMEEDDMTLNSQTRQLCDSYAEHYRSMQA